MGGGGGGGGGGLAYCDNKDFKKSSSMKPVVRIHNNLIEMITECPSTKIAKRI